MYNKFSVVVLVLLAFGIGYSLNNIAISDTNHKIAVVDTAKIISNSSEVKAIKAEQDTNLKKIQKTLKQAQDEISKETDSQKAAKLEEKYREEINRQKIAMDTSYNKKVSELNNKIHTAAANTGKQLNYNIVLPKDIVLWGGDDITSDVEKALK